MTFRSDGERCVGRLYRPDRPAEPPLVVLSGGLLGTSSSGLSQYAERLAAAGYASFRFDVRYTGDSDGTPRNLLAPARQRTDWEAAIAGLRGRGDVPTDRLVLWGTDLAGGTVLDVAANDTRIRAVVSQTPILSGRAFLRARGPGFFARGVLAGVRDLIQSPLVGIHDVAVASGSGDDSRGPALVSSPNASRKYRELVSDDEWTNRTPGRSLLALARDTAHDDRERISCPTLFVGGTRDDVVALDEVQAAADSLLDATLIRLPVDHFDLYAGDGVEQAVGHGLAFLETAVEP